MSEWRQKRYYDPRVLIEIARVLTPDLEPGLICLSGGQVEILRNITKYLHYRSTWVDEYHEGYYLAPTNEQWDDLQGVVADLEDKLMNCQQYDQILTDILAAAQCACYASRASLNLDYDPTDSEQAAAFTIDDVIPDGDVTQAGSAACALAQLWYQWGYEVITEQVLPASRWTWDYLLSAIAGFAGLAIGGPPVAIGLYAIAEAVQELLNVFYDASESNLVNWLQSQKEELVCSLWGGIVTGGDASDVWADTYADVVSPSSEISNTDKLIVNLFMGRWAGVNAQEAYEAATDWATSNVTAGYCDDCPLPPVVGSDWWALPMPEAENTVNIPHPSGSYWASGCWDGYVPDGYTLAGVVLEVTRYTACDCKRMSVTEAGCSGSGLWGNQASGDLQASGTYFCVNGANIDEAECKAAIAPGATDRTNVNLKVGPLDVSGGFQVGYTCDGEYDIWVKYMVFEGTTPF